MDDTFPVDPALLRRLLRPARRPGVADPAAGRALVVRHTSMGTPLPLAALVARHTAAEAEPGDVPIVYARPAHPGTEDGGLPSGARSGRRAGSAAEGGAWAVDGSSGVYASGGPAHPPIVRARPGSPSTGSAAGLPTGPFTDPTKSSELPSLVDRQRVPAGGVTPPPAVLPRPARTAGAGPPVVPVRPDAGEEGWSGRRGGTGDTRRERGTTDVGGINGTGRTAGHLGAARDNRAAGGGAGNGSTGRGSTGTSSTGSSSTGSSGAGSGGAGSGGGARGFGPAAGSAGTPVVAPVAGRSSQRSAPAALVLAGGVAAGRHQQAAFGGRPPGGPGGIGPGGIGPGSGPGEIGPSEIGSGGTTPGGTMRGGIRPDGIGRGAYPSAARPHRPPQPPAAAPPDPATVDRIVRLVQRDLVRRLAVEAERRAVR